jgi:hypothetical protein
MKKEQLSNFTLQKVNSNRHKPRGMGLLDNSIAKDGWIGSITVTADNETFDGSARLETAYGRFGEDVEPIIVDADGTRPIIVRRTDIPNADDPRAKRLSVAANRVAEVNLDYDLEVLAELHEEVDLSEMFFADEIAALMEKEQSEIPHETKEENEDELNEALDNVGKVESRVKLGEIWALGRHRICCGDSTVESNVKALLGDRFGDVGMVWSDPPYGINAVSKNGKTGTRKPTPFRGAKNRGENKKEVAATIYSPIIGDDGIETASKCAELLLSIFSQSVHFWWGANHYVKPFNESSCWIIWDKQTDGNNFADAELAWCNHSSTVRMFRHMWQGMVKASEHGQKRVHPTQKPIALCEWVFDKYGQSDDIIFDPFLGSAPSIIAAQKMEGDRTVYGFELSLDYCETIIQRYENFTGDIAKLVGRLPN